MFRIFRPKPRFVAKCRLKSRFSQNVDQNRDFSTFPLEWDFRKIWPKSRFLATFDQNREIFGKFRPKSRFSKISTKIKFFFANFDQNLHFWNLDQNANFEIFENFEQNRDFRTFRPKSRFSQNMTQIEIICKIQPKSRFFFIISTKSRFLKTSTTKIEIIKNFDQNRDFSKIPRKIKLIDNFDKISMFRIFRPKPRFVAKCRLKSRFSHIST